MARRDAEEARDLVEAAGADAVGALLVFLNLLESQAERLTELFLTHAEHDAAHADTAADILVNRVGRFGGHLDTPGIARRSEATPTCLRRRYRQILLGGSGTNEYKLSIEMTGCCFWLRNIECGDGGGPVNGGIADAVGADRTYKQQAARGLQTPRLTRRRRTTSSSATANMTEIGISPSLA